MESMINGEFVRILRSEQAWSQEELASAADVSLRTIQRIEKSGSCSLESKKALAAVFGIDVKSLEIDQRAAEIAKGRRSGFLGAGVGLIGAYVGITYSLQSGELSVGEAGIYYGATAAFCGICAAMVGVLSRKQENG